MKKLLVLCLFVLVPVAVLAQDSASDDVLGRILSEAGFTRADLGYRPTGYWNRFPLDTPYRLPSFDDLFAEPLRLYDYARVMANTTALYLDPAIADSADDVLYKLVYNLGVDKRLGGFRSYSANLVSAPDGPRPVIAAIESVYRLAGQSTVRASFGAASPMFDTASTEYTALAALPDSTQLALAELIVNLGDAVHWRTLAFRHCDPADVQKTVAIRDLSETQGDGQVYYPELDNLAAAVDWPSLHYAALKTAAAVERAEHKLRRSLADVHGDLYLDIPTPYGRIVLVGRKHRSVIDAANSLLVVDFGGNTVYTGSAAAAVSPTAPVSVVLDLGGDDTYGDPAWTGDTLPAPPIAGVGLCGVGLLLDSDGNDRYFGGRYAQGAGLFGVGVLFDRFGDDHYAAALSAQGCGYFGIGMCLDAGGDDTSYIYGAGQGLGGVGGGVGVCASFDGNDSYTAEPYASVYNRGDYHSEHTINGNEAQGAGFGRRGDGSDGHSWAGGLGAIIDIHGDDHYRSGNWSLGVGYWFATGIAVDEHGDDVYESCYFTQGSGAHYCNGILLDEAGDDKHELFETAGAALGFGWDYTNALLINKGGNDSYRAKMISMGLAQIRSCALLVDIGGDDRYALGDNTPGLGEATYRDDYRTPSDLTPYYYYSKSFGGFIDIGGNDTYTQFTVGDDAHDAAQSGAKRDKSGSTAKSAEAESPHPDARNDALWLQPARTDSTFGANNFGIGIDVDSGAVPDFTLWDK